MKFIILACATITVCLSYSVALQTKCKLGDSNCTRNQLNEIYKEIIENGMDEIGIQKSDPYQIKNVGVNVLGLVHLTMLNGTATGLKTCKIISMKIDEIASRAEVDVACDNFHIGGHYKIKTLPLLHMITGLNVHADGDGRIDVEKLQLQCDIAYSVDNGKHIQLITEESSCMLNGPTYGRIDANNIYINDQDMSHMVMTILNNNWLPAVKLVGNPIAYHGTQIIFKIINQYLSTVPADQLIY